MKLGVAIVTTALSIFVAASASAALTSSEKAQVKDYTARARIDTAPRVRSLVARTDLTADESIEAMTDALAPVPFTAERAAFVHELVFGGSSAASRPLLAHAIVRGVLARAAAIHQKFAGGLDHEPPAIAELVAIYAFLDADIANAGRPTESAHDASAGIPAATYEDCSKALRDHVDQNARYLKGDGAIAESVARVRAQAQIAVLDMLPDGITRRVDAADRVGLSGVRRQILADWGILIADAGTIDDLEAERLRHVLSRLPGARADLEVIFAGTDRGPLRARGVAMFVTVGTTENPFGDEVTPGTFDAPAFAHDLADLAAKRALDNRGELRLQAERDATSTRGDVTHMLGKPRAPSVDHVVGAAVQLLVLDAPRAVDLAFSRALAGKPESAAILSDAIGALAAFRSLDKRGLTIEVGKSNGKATLTDVRLAPNGVVTSFTLEGHVWTIERSSPLFAVTAINRDGQPLKLADLSTVRPPAKKN